jgi:hypothetical protein
MHYVSNGASISVTVLQQLFDHQQLWEAFEAIVTTFGMRQIIAEKLPSLPEDESDCPFSNQGQFSLTNPDEIFYLSSSYSLNA